MLSFKLSVGPKSVRQLDYIFLDWQSAMMIILAGTKREHLDMLEGGVIEMLLEEKWKTFAQVSDHIPKIFFNKLITNKCGIKLSLKI